MTLPWRLTYLQTPLVKKSWSNRFNRKIHDLNTIVRWNLGFRPPIIEETSGFELCPLETPLIGPSPICGELETRFYQKSSIAQTTYPEPHLFRLRDVYMTGDRGYLFTKKDEWIRVCPESRYEMPKKARHPIPALAKKIDEPVFHMTGGNHENRAHYVLQHLPRLLVALPFLKSRPDIKVLVAPGHRRWQCEYFEMMGIPSNRVIEGSVGTLQCREVYYVPPFYADNNLVAPAFYHAMHRLFVGEKEATKDQILFVSRRDAPERRMLNEDAVIASLEKKFGPVNCVMLPGKTLAERIALFQRARMVVAPGGQGLASLLFVRNIPVLILCPESWLPAGWNASFRDLAEFMGCSAIRLFSDAPIDEERDWEYPIPHFEEQIDRFIDLLKSPITPSS